VELHAVKADDGFVRGRRVLGSLNTPTISTRP
jgi:hypothetical protein